MRGEEIHVLKTMCRMQGKRRRRTGDTREKWCQDRMCWTGVHGAREWATATPYHRLRSEEVESILYCLTSYRLPTFRLLVLLPSSGLPPVTARSSSRFVLRSAVKVDCIAGAVYCVVVSTDCARPSCKIFQLRLESIPAPLERYPLTRRWNLSAVRLLCPGDSRSRKSRAVRPRDANVNDSPRSRIKFN